MLKEKKAAKLYRRKLYPLANIRVNLPMHLGELTYGIKSINKKIRLRNKSSCIAVFLVDKQVDGCYRYGCCHRCSSCV